MAEEQAPEAVMSEAKLVTDAIGNALIEHLKSGNAAPPTGLMPPIIARALLAAELRGREQQKQADARIEERADEFEEALIRIEQWADAYPLDIFPEPDFKRARQLLEAGGISLGAISASNMRHVIEGVGKIAKSALATTIRQ